MHFTIEFDKNANSVGGMCFNTHSIKLCFATVGVCVFYASAPAGAFFNLGRDFHDRTDGKSFEKTENNR